MKKDISHQFTIDDDGNVTYHGNYGTWVSIGDEEFDKDEFGNLIYKGTSEWITKTTNHDN